MRKLLAVCFFLLLGSLPAFSQVLNPVTPLDGGAPVSASNPLHVTGGGGGGGAAVGPTAVGSPSANPPVQVGGTADGTATGTMQTLTVKPASTTALSTDTGAVVQLNPLSPGLITTGSVAAPSTQTVSVVNYPASAATGGYNYTHIAAGQATSVIKNNAGTLHSITFNGAATASNVTSIYDNPSTSGTVIGIANPSTTGVASTAVYDVAFASGLTIITTVANGADMTVSWK